MVFVSLCNSYIKLRRNIRTYCHELLVANEQPARLQAPSSKGPLSPMANVGYSGNQNYAMSPDMAVLEKELQSLHMLAGTATPMATCTRDAVAPMTEPKAVNTVVEGADTENTTPDKQVAKPANGRYAYITSAAKKAANKQAINTASASSPSTARNALGSINSNARTEPQRWRVNQKPVETLSTDEVAVALLSKFA